MEYERGARQHLFTVIGICTDAARPIRRQECSVAVLVASACSVAVQWKQPDDHSSEHDKPVMPPCQKMLAMLCSSDTEGDLVFVFLTQFHDRECVPTRWSTLATLIAITIE